MRPWYLFMIIAVISVPSLSYSEHDDPIKLDFPNTVSGYSEVVNNFSLAKDGIVYFSITANVLPSQSTTYLLNFQKKCANYSVGFGEFVDKLGYEYGPFALEAGDYSIKTSVNTTQSTTYTTSVTYRYQSLPNDTEPNNRFPDEVQELGLLQSGSNVPGHIGYSCRSSYTDYDNFKFQTESPGDYFFKINHDQFDAQCLLNFTLTDGSRPIASNLKGASGEVFGPYKLEKGISYYWNVSLSICQVNYGGAYEIQYSLVPPRVTQPFSVNSVTITPAAVFWGSNYNKHNVQTVITNNSGNPINNINLDITVKKESNQELITNKPYTISLTPYQQKGIALSLVELLGGQTNIDRLKDDKYSVTAWARQSELGHESTQSGYFVFYRNPEKILGALTSSRSLLLNNSDKK